MKGNIKVAILSSKDVVLWKMFLSKYKDELTNNNISIDCVAIDLIAEKKKKPIRYFYKIAKRKAQISRCSTLSSIIRIIAYKVISRNKEGLRDLKLNYDLLSDINVKQVESLNNKQAQNYLSNNFDLICLMGTRILKKELLSVLNCPVINIHSSDPRLIRGGPEIFWEIYYKMDVITLTIHEVVEKLDAGKIILEKEIPIFYENNLRKTIWATKSRIYDEIADLYFNAIINFAKDMEFKSKTNYVPGPVHVVPSIIKMIKANKTCIRKSNEYSSST